MPPEAPARRRLASFFWIALWISACDQLTKAWALMVLEPRGVVTVIPELLDLVMVRNRGVAFGIFNDGDRPWQALALGVLAVLAMTLIVRLVWRLPEPALRQRVGLALIFGGAAGNLLDRLRLGEVVDFVDVYVGQWHWPAFNLADSSICVGVGLLLLDFGRREARKGERVPDTA
jgi:signal peptidase II